MPQDGASAALTFYPAYCFSASPTYNTWAKLSAADVHALKQRPGYEGQRLYFHLNHPIRYIRLVGLVTSFDPSTSTTLLTGPSRIARTTHTPYTFTLDDGSGATIPVICWPPETPPPSDPNSNHAQRASEFAQYSRELIHSTFADRHSRPARTILGKDVHLDEVELGKVVKVKGWVDEFRGSRQILLERVTVIRDTREEVEAWRELAEWQRDVLGWPWRLGEGEVRGLRMKAERRSRRKAAGISKGEKRKRDGDTVAAGGVDGRIREVAEKADDDAIRPVATALPVAVTEDVSDDVQPTRCTEVAAKKTGDDAQRSWAAFEPAPSAEDAPEVFQRRHRTRVVPTQKTGDNASRSLTPAERPRPQANTKAARKHQSS